MSIAYYSVRNTARQCPQLDGGMLLHDATRPFAVVAVLRIDADTWRVVRVLSRHTTRSGASRSARYRTHKLFAS